ncbi:hypothetical protein RRG08_008283 [Elysia crispata]|uniref:Uncharacterized protein n=1 Tax=Elysia crispata TaxID=231223 RepID=A0AAE0ZMQ7_9GAST|nr:hypothetical protein RRG08_008283 [Elysia crispata]
MVSGLFIARKTGQGFFAVETPSLPTAWTWFDTMPSSMSSVWRAESARYSVQLEWPQVSAEEGGGQHSGQLVLDKHIFTLNISCGANELATWASSQDLLPNCHINMEREKVWARRLFRVEQDIQTPQRLDDFDEIDEKTSATITPYRFGRMYVSRISRGQPGSAGISKGQPMAAGVTEYLPSSRLISLSPVS